MSWRLTTTAAIVLVLASTMATHAANSGHERDIPEWEQYWAELGKIYRRVKTREIRYGTEGDPPGTSEKLTHRSSHPIRTRSKSSRSRHSPTGLGSSTTR